MAVNGEGTELGWLGGGGELLLVDAMRLCQVPRPPPGARRRQPPDLREAKPGREREAERADGVARGRHEAHAPGSGRSTRAERAGGARNAEQGAGGGRGRRGARRAAARPPGHGEESLLS